MNIRLASYSVLHTTYVARTAFRPRPRFVTDYQNEVRPHDLHRDLALRWRSAVQFEPKRYSKGKVDL